MMKIFNKKAFTLAELMAVVVIIAIIAGIGLGSYRKSVERARFNEAVGVATALAAAVDEYYYDHMFTSITPTTTNINNLAIDITGGTVSGNTLTTENFTYKVYSQRVEATRNGGNYGVIALVETSNQVGTNSPATLCSFTNAEGEEFCKSLGYSCSFNSSGYKKCSE